MSEVETKPNDIAAIDLIKSSIATLFTAKGLVGTDPNELAAITLIDSAVKTLESATTLLGQN